MAGGRDLEPLYFEAGAASVLGIAAGYAGLALSASPPLAAAVALAGSIGAFFVLLRSAAPAQLTLPAFAAAILAEGELLLTPEQRVHPDELLLDRPLPLGELLLEDRLTPAEDVSRVVRLFDCSRLSDPGELQARIERHLQASREPRAEPLAPSDDSAALHQALAALKHSLR